MREMALRVESNVDAPRISRSHISEFRPALEPRFDDVLLLVSELVTNSVRHSDTESIEIRLSAANGQIRLEVIDDGPGFDPRSPRGDGMGLNLVDKLADRWGMRAAERFTVWAELQSVPG